MPRGIPGSGPHARTKKAAKKTAKKSVKFVGVPVVRGKVVDKTSKKTVRSKPVSKSYIEPAVREQLTTDTPVSVRNAEISLSNLRKRLQDAVARYHAARAKRIDDIVVEIKPMKPNVYAGAHGGGFPLNVWLTEYPQHLLRVLADLADIGNRLNDLERGLREIKSETPLDLGAIHKLRTEVGSYYNEFYQIFVPPTQNG